jgi:nitroreductase
METLKAIEKRNSVRRFLEIPIKHSDLTKILKAGSQAPTSANIITTSITVVTKKEKKEQIANACLNQTWITQAPIVLVLCSDIESIKDIYKNRAELYATQNAAVTAQNILIAATDLDIGSCFVSAFTNSPLQKALELPKHIKPQVVIPLGYSDDKKTKKKRERLQNMIFFEKYGKKTKSSIFPLKKHKNKIKKLIKKI